MEKRYYFSLDGVNVPVSEWVERLQVDHDVRVLDEESAIERIAEVLGSREIEDWDIWEGAEDMLEELGIEYEEITYDDGEE